jgi:hypothetical protein
MLPCMWWHDAARPVAVVPHLSQLDLGEHGALQQRIDTVHAAQRRDLLLVVEASVESGHLEDLHGKARTRRRGWSEQQGPARELMNYVIVFVECDNLV